MSACDTAEKDTAVLVSEVLSSIMSESVEDPFSSAVEHNGVESGGEEIEEAKEKVIETGGAVEVTKEADADVVKSGTGTEQRPKIDKLEAKEKELQSARQVWAIFDALGPGKAPKKCDRPFVGRQQELYEECFALVLGNHLQELKLAAIREKFDKELACMESMFILKGITQLEDDDDKELTMLEYWYMELKAFMAVRDATLQKKSDPKLAKMFDVDDLCSSVEYTPGENYEALSFTTRRQKKAYSVEITLKGISKVDVNVEPIDKEMDFKVSNSDLKRLLKLAIKKRVTTQQMVRVCIWQFVDKVQELSSVS